MTDHMNALEATSRSGNLSVAWIDSEKAYDRVPHGWLELVLRAPAIVRRSVKYLIPLWESEFTVRTGANTVKTNLTFKWGLFQGDSLSPILFCLSIEPCLEVPHIVTLGLNRCFTQTTMALDKISRNHISNDWGISGALIWMLSIKRTLPLGGLLHCFVTFSTTLCGQRRTWSRWTRRWSRWYVSMVSTTSRPL